MTVAAHLARPEAPHRWSWIDLVAVLVAAAFLLPLAYLLSVSFKSPDQVLSGSFLPEAPTLANWPAAFGATALTRFIVNSVLTAVLGGVVTILIALPAAYACLRLDKAGERLVSIAFGSFVAPPIVAAIPFFFLLKAAGLLNSVIGLALVYGLTNVPVALWLLMPFLRRIPREIEDAAAIDGAGPLLTLVRVIAPLVAPGIAATAIIVVILGYNEFLFASVFTFADETRTLTVGISLFQGDRLVNFGQMAAASLAGIAPIYLIALLAQRWLVAGLTEGSVK